MYNKIIIGIDQSYQDTGVSICADGELMALSDISFTSSMNNSMKRKEVTRRISGLLERMIPKTKDLKIIIERIRLRSDGFINIDYIKSIGALNAVIVDIANSYGIEVFSVDTRAWKSKIVGTVKPLKNKYGFDEKKWPTIKYIIGLGFEKQIKKSVSKKKKKAVITDANGEKYTYNDNIADSACIALYGFFGEENKLILEH